MLGKRGIGVGDGGVDLASMEAKSRRSSIEGIQNGEPSVRLDSNPAGVRALAPVTS
jgi:hypothetical protein